MKRVFFLGLLFLTVGTAEAKAANLAVITHPPTALSLLVLILAGAGLVVCWQVLTLVRGGKLGKVWQVFLLGFLLLALSRAAALLSSFEVLAVPELIPAVLMLAMAGLFFYGLIEARRVLG
jgi:hypothetical protein